MWLLSTARAELKFFDNPSSVDEYGGYAILSHTWGHEEDSFQVVKAAIARCGPTGENPRDFVSDKIRNCCIEAERDGYTWVWIDTCCINKDSSAELAEAINAMFSYYARAEFCYVYLEDVPAIDDIEAPDSAFRAARWHSRGWTLQELLASPSMVFLSKDWTPLGTKSDLIELLSDISDIPEVNLIHPKSIHVSTVSMRMAWAAHRQTSRVEDAAYSLLGIFGVTMPIIYGEGDNAFQRLQKEIIEKTCDTTIFAWRPDYHLSEHFRAAATETLEHIWEIYHGGFHRDLSCFLLAKSPNEFEGLRGNYFTPRLPRGLGIQPYMPHQWPDQPLSAGDIEKRENGPFGSVQLPSFKMSPHGMECLLPVGVVGEITIAVLLSETQHEHIGLLLHPAEASELQDPHHKAYYVGWALRTPNGHRYCRVAHLGKDLYRLRFRNQVFQAQWKRIVIRASPHPGDVRSVPHPFMLSGVDNMSKETFRQMRGIPFRIPGWLLNSLFRLSFFPVAGVGETKEDAHHETLLQFNDTSAGESLLIQLGICAASSDAAAAHWARATLLHKGSDLTRADIRVGHQCNCDHVDDWSNGEKTIESDGRILRMAFAPCPRAPHSTRVLYLELEGSVYEELQCLRGVRIPSRTALKKPTPSAVQASDPVPNPPLDPPEDPQKSHVTELQSSASLPNRIRTGEAKIFTRVIDIGIWIGIIVFRDHFSGLTRHVRNGLHWMHPQAILIDAIVILLLPIVALFRRVKNYVNWRSQAVNSAITAK